MEQNKKRNNKKNYALLVLLLLLTGLGIGYAILSTNLNITGSSSIKDAQWDIHFNNLNVSGGSVATTGTDSAATIDTATKTRVDYTITLNKPGDYYEFTVDVVNGGSIDAMVATVSSKLDNVEIETLPSYLNYSVSYLDGKKIAANHLLAAGATETYKVRVEYKKDISAVDLPATDTTLSFTFAVSYVQASDLAVNRSDVLYVYRNNTENVDANASLSDLGTYYGTYQAVVNATGKNYFLRHKIEGTEVVESSVGFVYGGNVYYLQGGGITFDEETGTYGDSPNYAANKEILDSVFGSTNCTEEDGFYDCTGTGLNADASNDGGVDAYIDDNNFCDVDGFGASFCM